MQIITVILKTNGEIIVVSLFNYKLITQHSTTLNKSVPKTNKILCGPENFRELFKDFYFMSNPKHLNNFKRESFLLLLF